MVQTRRKKAEVEKVESPVKAGKRGVSVQNVTDTVPSTPGTPRKRGRPRKSETVGKGGAKSASERSFSATEDLDDGNLEAESQETQDDMSSTPESVPEVSASPKKSTRRLTRSRKETPEQEQEPAPETTADVDSEDVTTADENVEEESYSMEQSMEHVTTASSKQPTTPEEETRGDELNQETEHDDKQTDVSAPNRTHRTASESDHVEECERQAESASSPRFEEQFEEPMDIATPESEQPEGNPSSSPEPVKHITMPTISQEAVEEIMPDFAPAREHVTFHVKMETVDNMFDIDSIPMPVISTEVSGNVPGIKEEIREVDKDEEQSNEKVVVNKPTGLVNYDSDDEEVDSAFALEQKPLRVATAVGKKLDSDLNATEDNAVVNSMGECKISSAVASASDSSLQEQAQTYEQPAQEHTQSHQQFSQQQTHGYEQFAQEQAHNHHQFSQEQSHSYEQFAQGQAQHYEHHSRDHEHAHSHYEAVRHEEPVPYYTPMRPNYEDEHERIRKYRLQQELLRLQREIEEAKKPKPHRIHIFHPAAAAFQQTEVIKLPASADEIPLPPPPPATPMAPPPISRPRPAVQTPIRSFFSPVPPPPPPPGRPSSFSRMAPPTVVTPKPTLPFEKTIPTPTPMLSPNSSLLTEHKPFVSLPHPTPTPTVITPKPSVPPHKTMTKVSPIKFRIGDVKLAGSLPPPTIVTTKPSLSTSSEKTTPQPSPMLSPVKSRMSDMKASASVPPPTIITPKPSFCLAPSEPSTSSSDDAYPATSSAQKSPRVEVPVEIPAATALPAPVPAPVPAPIEEKKIQTTEHAEIKVKESKDLEKNEAAERADARAKEAEARAREAKNLIQIAAEKAAQIEEKIRREEVLRREESERRKEEREKRHQQRMDEEQAKKKAKEKEKEREKEKEKEGRVPEKWKLPENEHPLVENEKKEDVRVKEEVMDAKDMVVPPFELIEQCRYLTKNATKKKSESLFCFCAESGGNCSDGRCVNRSMLTECPISCPVNKCKNQRFAKRKYAQVEAFHTGTRKGCGLRAIADIKRGNFIIEYVGEVVERDDYEKRKVKYADDKNHQHHYLCDTGTYTIDATVMGNPSRFINHSCEPNAICEKWCVPKTPGDVSRIGFFAKREIFAGEEITFDYQFVNYGREAQKCHCGAEKCNGWIGTIPEEVSEDSDDEDVVTTRELEHDEEEKRMMEIENMNPEDRKDEIDSLMSELVLRTKKHSKRVIKIASYMDDYEQMSLLLDEIFSQDTSLKLQMHYASEGMTSLLSEWLSFEDYSVDCLMMKQKILQVLHGDPFIASARKEQRLLDVVYLLAKGEGEPQGVDEQCVVDALVECVSEDTAHLWPAVSRDVSNEIRSNFERLRVMAVRLNNFWFNRSVNFRIPKKVREPVTVKEKEEEKMMTMIHEETRSMRNSRYSSTPYSYQDRQEDWQPRGSYGSYRGFGRYRGYHHHYNNYYRDYNRKRPRRSRSRSPSPYYKRNRSIYDEERRSPVPMEQCSTPSDSPSSSGDRVVDGNRDTRSTTTPMTMPPHPQTVGMTPAPGHFTINPYDYSHPMYGVPFNPYAYASMGYPVPAHMDIRFAGGSDTKNPPKEFTKEMMPSLQQMYHMFQKMMLPELKSQLDDQHCLVKMLQKLISDKEREQEPMAYALGKEEFSRSLSTESCKEVKEPPPKPNRYTWARAKSETGETYYYNKVTKETQWSPPRPEQGDLDPFDRTPPDTTDECDAEHAEERHISSASTSLHTRVGEMMWTCEEIRREAESSRFEDARARETMDPKRYEQKSRDFKISLERVIAPIVRGNLTGVEDATDEKTSWLIKLVVKEMFKRQSKEHDFKFRLNDQTEKMVRKYTESLMERKMKNGGADLWKGYKPSA